MPPQYMGQAGPSQQFCAASKYPQMAPSQPLHFEPGSSNDMSAFDRHVPSVFTPPVFPAQQPAMPQPALAYSSDYDRQTAGASRPHGVQNGNKWFRPEPSEAGTASTETQTMRPPPGIRPRYKQSGDDAPNQQHGKAAKRPNQQRKQPQGAHKGTKGKGKPSTAANVSAVREQLSAMIGSAVSSAMASIKPSAAPPTQAPAEPCEPDAPGTS